MFGSRLGLVIISFARLELPNSGASAAASKDSGSLHTHREHDTRLSRLECLRLGRAAVSPPPTPQHPYPLIHTTPRERRSTPRNQRPRTTAARVRQWLETLSLGAPMRHTFDERPPPFQPLTGTVARCRCAGDAVNMR